MIIIKIKNSKLPYLFLLPALIIVFGLLIYPIFTVFYNSFQNLYLNKPYLNGYAGLENYIKIFTDDEIFISSLWISFKWVFTQVSLQLVCGMIIALVLNKTFKGRGIFRSIIFTPWAISAVLISIMWSLMYHEQIGVINDLLLKIGMIKDNIAWLSNLNTVFPAVVIAELWRGIPFFTIMLLAGLQSIPVQIYESAEVDGANKLQKFIYITLPFLKDTIILSTLLRGCWEFNNVDIIFNMTGGGPMHLTTTLPIYIVTNALRATNYGYGSALTIIGVLILAFFAFGYLTLSGFTMED